MPGSTDLDLDLRAHDRTPVRARWRWQTLAIASADDLRRFDDDTAFDRQILEAVVGRDLLLRELPTGDTDDLRGSNLSAVRSAFDSLDGGAIEALTDRFRPLLFATAWKLLDLVVELVGQSSGAAPPAGRRWPIVNKVAWARAAPAPPIEPFASNRHLWRVTVNLYARLEDSRNAVIHRRHRRDASGAVVPYGRSGRPLRPIAPREIDAMVFFSYGLSEEVVSGIASNRREIALSCEPTSSAV